MSHWRHAADVLWRRTLDTVVVATPGTAAPVMLTGVGAVVWQRLAEPVETWALARSLAATFDVPVERVHADLVPLLEELERRGFVRVEP